MHMRENQLLEQSIELSTQVIQTCKKIKLDAISTPIVSQVIRSATSVSANISEASVAMLSYKEMRYRLSISLRECVETETWLLLMKRSLFIKQDDYDKMSGQCLSIKKMLISSMKTLNYKTK